MRSLLRKLLHRQTLYWLRFDIRCWMNRLRYWRLRQDKTNAEFLNVGCGNTGLVNQSWFNIDGFAARGVDLVWTFRGKLPFPPNRFRGIYSEHFLEHLTPESARQFLGECRRILRPDGVLRLSVPDGEIYVRNYFENRAWMLARRGGALRTPMEVLNVLFRQEFEHQYCYDYETLHLWLEEAGFAHIIRADYGVGRISEMLIDQNERRFESLYVEAYLQ